MTNLLRIPYILIRPFYERTSMHRSVIDEVEDHGLKDAFATCRAITREHAKTFYMATRFLPNDKQRGIFAIYALCRFIDDLVDEAEDLIRNQKVALDEIESRLDTWKERLEDTYRGRYHDHAILLAFSNVLRNYDIPIELPFQLMDGVCMDLYKNRYQNFEELYSYSYKVASVVGLMTSEVFGYEDPQALDYAVDLGIAMQLTNILRDVGEDLDQNRIYLPQKDLHRFGVTEQDLFEHRMTKNFADLMDYQIYRAREFYIRARKGIPMLNKDSRLPVYLAHENYGRILQKIEKNKYNVFTNRAYLNTTEKIAIIPRIFYRICMPAA